jgi:hypothetical protein
MPGKLYQPALALQRALRPDFQDRLRPLKTRAASVQDWGWRGFFLLKELVLAALQASGITITVLAATIPLAIAFSPGWKPVLAVFLLSLPASGAIALWTADPQTYARLLLAGRPAKEVLFVISWHALRACKRTLRQAGRIASLTRSLDERVKGPPFGSPKSWILSDDRKEHWKIDDFREHLRKFIQKEHSALLRIEAMKLLASEELDIPQRRLCDHVFQYSPAMHRDRLQKYLGTWGEIMNFPPVQSPDDVERFRGLLHQNRSFLDNVERRIGYQRQILKNRDLHPFIVQFASMHSTSGSLHTYAEALRFLVVTGLMLSQSPEDILDRLRFVHRKQRAHPGFDLHALLLRACECMRGLKGIDPEELERLVHVLQKLDEPPRSPSSQLDVSPLCRYLSQEGGLKPFLSLPANLSRLVTSQHGKICGAFRALYDDWFRDVPAANRYIVSHGYSRTVLSVLKSALSPAPGDSRVFFILPEEKASLDTRIMEYEIKAQEELRAFRNFAAGTEHHLLNLLTYRDFVLVLLGAECFDRKNRVVHPRGPVQGFGSLLQELRNREIRYLVAVVAETYKLHTVELTADTNFYGQHFDRIELYSPDWIDLILTDDPDWPADGKRIVAKRRGGVPDPAGALHY